jgi:hypothetical protein
MDLTLSKFRAFTLFHVTKGVNYLQLKWFETRPSKNVDQYVEKISDKYDIGVI